jgi:hypothetical protein
VVSQLSGRHGWGYAPFEGALLTLSVAKFLSPTTKIGGCRDMSEGLMRVCPVCGEHKPLDEMARDASQPSGVASRCKLCDRSRRRAPRYDAAQKRAYYQANRERILAAARERRARKHAANQSRPRNNR